MPDSRQDLSPGARIAIGVAMLALGIGVVALGAEMLLVEPSPSLASDGVIGLPIGMVFAFGGLLLAVPTRFTRLRVVAAALLVTAFALTADWIAFGPGKRAFGGFVGWGPIGVRGHPSETFGRTAFGICAVLLDLLAVLTWVRAIRGRWKP